MDFHRAATAEMTEAAEWYETKGVGVGARFLDAVQQAMQILTEHPQLGAVWENPALPRDVTVRRVPLRVFPFLIVYLLEPRPTVMAVAHGSRRPSYWLGRLQ